MEKKQRVRSRKRGPSYRCAVSVPLKPWFRCDNQCSEKTLSYWQLASVVLNEGDEACTRQETTCVRTVGLQQTPAGKRRKTTAVKPVQWRQVVRKEGVSWKNVENDGERTIFCVGCGNTFSKKEAE